MKIHAIVVTEVATPDRPYLVDAWDHALVEANPRGWWDNVAEESKGGHTTAAVVIEVPDGDLLALLHPASPPVVRGTARSDRPR